MSRYGDAVQSSRTRDRDDRGEARYRGGASDRNDSSRKHEPSKKTRVSPRRVQSPLRDQSKNVGSYHNNNDSKTRNRNHSNNMMTYSRKAGSHDGRPRERRSSRSPAGRYDRGHTDRQRSARKSPETRRRSPQRRRSNRSYSSDRYSSSSDFTGSSRSYTLSSVSSDSRYSSASRDSRKNRRDHGDRHNDSWKRNTRRRGDTTIDRSDIGVNSKQNTTKTDAHPSNTGSAPYVPADFRCHICKGSGHWTRCCTFLSSPQANALLTSSSNHQFAKIDRYRGCWECGINDGHPFFRCPNRMFLCKSCGDMHTTEDCPHEYKSIEYHEYFDDEKGHCYFERQGGDDEIDFCLDEHGVMVPRWYAKLALKDLAMTHTQTPKNNVDYRTKEINSGKGEQQKGETPLGLKNDKTQNYEGSQKRGTISSVTNGNNGTKDIPSTNHNDEPMLAKEGQAMNGVGKRNRDNGRGRRDRFRSALSSNVNLVFRCPYDNHILTYDEVSLERSIYAEKLRERKRKEAIFTAPITPPIPQNAAYVPVLPPYTVAVSTAAVSSELPAVLGDTIDANMSVTPQSQIFECLNDSKINVTHDSPEDNKCHDNKVESDNKGTTISFDENKKTDKTDEEDNRVTEIENGSVNKTTDNYQKDVISIGNIDNDNCGEEVVNGTNTTKEATSIPPDGVDEDIIEKPNHLNDHCSNNDNTLGYCGSGTQSVAENNNNNNNINNKPANPRITWYIRAHALDVVLWHCNNCRVLLPKTVNECVLCHRERPTNMSEKLRKERDEKRRKETEPTPHTEQTEPTGDVVAEEKGGVEGEDVGIKKEDHNIAKGDNCTDEKSTEEGRDTTLVALGGKRPRDEDGLTTTA